MKELLKNFHLDLEAFKKIVDNLYDEVMICDNEYKIVYVNKACYRHYRKTQNEMIGQNFWDLEQGKYWSSSVLPYVFKEKKGFRQKQKNFAGENILTIAVPIFNDKEEIEYVAISVRDNFQSGELQSLLEIEEVHEKSISDFDKSIVYRSETMKNVMKLIHKIAKVKSSCLILGESGTGKSLIAQYMHKCSHRKDKPFININCASIHRELMEAELFGYRRGAFTGANKQGRKGLIELADGGTLFLDEIAEIPYHLQAKILQVIQDEEFIPVGGQEVVKVDIKIIAATNRNLEQMVEMGSFRQDLYYRLNVFEVMIPPLRERNEDIIDLTYYFLELYTSRYDKHQDISKDALDILRSYSWRGNIRELSHIIERLVVTVNEDIIQPYHLPSYLYEFQKDGKLLKMENLTLDKAKEEIEKQMIKDAYQSLGSTRKVAAKLNISQTRASRLIRKYVLE